MALTSSPCSLRRVLGKNQSASKLLALLVATMSLLLQRNLHRRGAVEIDVIASRAVKAMETSVMVARHVNVNRVSKAKVRRTLVVSPALAHIIRIAQLLLRRNRSRRQSDFAQVVRTATQRLLHFRLSRSRLQNRFFVEESPLFVRLSKSRMKRTRPKVSQKSVQLLC
ncbi:unannotated protein [freshwater metagenome]|uniref:Unannotated protein n=1 Tax=freshwater metagenome TaxID=449393 RepID=A0A6J6MUQ4_9ZZZZ